MPNPSDTSEDFDYSDGFAASIANEIGGSLFGSGEKAEPATPPAPSPAPAAPVVNAPAAAPAPEPHPNIVPGQNSETRPMPKSWRKEMESHWTKLPPEVHEYVHTREAQVMRGIQQYQESAQQWQNLIQPYAPVFQSQPDVQPVQIMQGLMNTHLQLLNPDLPQERKQSIVAKLLTDYGITMDGFTPPQVDPRVQSLEQQVQTLIRQNEAAQRAAYDAGVQDWTKKIEAFATDSKNVYFNEVGNDILRFIQTGVATDLAAAYDMACWANPAVRAKMLAQQANPPAPAPAPRAKNGQFVNLGDGTPPPTRTRAKSMEATIDEVIARNFSPSAH